MIGGGDLTLLETEDFFDYQCPNSYCRNYVLLEKNEKNKNILEGTCALCGENIDMLYEEWEKWDKKKFINEDEEVG